MADVLVDTDVCIDHLAGVRRLVGRRARLGYSVITRAELGAGARDEREREQIRRLLGAMTEYEVDRQVAEEAERNFARFQVAAEAVGDGRDEFVQVDAFDFFAARLDAREFQ